MIFSYQIKNYLIVSTNERKFLASLWSPFAATKKLEQVFSFLSGLNNKDK